MNFICLFLIHFHDMNKVILFFYCHYNYSFCYMTFTNIVVLNKEGKSL